MTVKNKKLFIILGIVFGALLVSLVVLWFLIAYAFIRMPFNGDVTFHDISLYVPEDYIRDSTKSNDGLWVYEYNHYTSYILIHRGEVGNPDTDLESYGAYISEHGGSIKQSKILDVDSIDLTYTQDNKECRETAFIYNGSIYSVALRGGSEEEFTALRDSITRRKE